MQKVLHLWYDVDRLYGSRKEGGREFAIIDASMQLLKDYIEEHGGSLITATRNNTDNTRIKKAKIWNEN